jgi:transposase
VFPVHIFRLGLLPEGYIYPPEECGLRDLARKRMQLIQQRTQNILGIENIVAQQVNLRLNAQQVRHLDNAAVTALRLPPQIECALMANLAVVRAPGSNPCNRNCPARTVKLRPEFSKSLPPFNG